MTFDDALTAFLLSREAINCKPRTLDWYRQQIGRFHEWLLEQSWNGSTWLQPEVLEAFLAAERRRGRSDSTVRARHRGLKVFFSWLKERGYLPEEVKNPAKVVRLGKEEREEPRYARQFEVEALLTSIDPGDWLDLRDRALIMLLDQAGVRVSEAVGLLVEDVDLYKRTVHIRKGTTKTAQGRRAPFKASLVLAFLSYLDVRPNVGPWLFVAATGGHRTPHGAALTDNGVRQMLERRCEAAGIEYVNPHAFRHGLAMRLLNDGRAPTSVIQSVLGHASESTTRNYYARWQSDALVDAYDEFIGRADDK